jgi:hypothetical protein
MPDPEPGGAKPDAPPPRGLLARFGAWLDEVPLVLLLLLAGWLAVAPVVPEPHLWEKLKMLAAGTLTRPIDIFDLFFHAAPLALLAWRLVRARRRAR